MKKGYILALSLKILLLVSTLFLIRYNSVFIHSYIISKSNYMYKRLEAEKAVFDEIIFNMSLYIDDDFTFFYNDYDFDIKISENDVIVFVESDISYTINLKYSDNCMCFSKISYD